MIGIRLQMENCAHTSFFKQHYVISIKAEQVVDRNNGGDIGGHFGSSQSLFRADKSLLHSW